MQNNDIVPFSSEEVVLARTFIESVTQREWGDEYSIAYVKHRDYITDDLADKIKDLTIKMLDDMPQEAKLYLFSKKMDIASFRMRLQGQRFKGYVRTSEALAINFQGEIKNIVEKLESNMEQPKH